MDPRWHALMFAVLDGEATPEESRELELLLAEYEVVRDEFASLQRFFGRLRSVPQLDAPQGLAEVALDRRQRNAPPERRSRRSGSNPRRGTMSPNRSKRSIWIGGGIAVAAVLAVAFFTIDYPPDRDKTAGTVAPAQRYRAEQPKAGDVKLGDQAVAQLMQTEAFDRFVKDPSTRALAADASFQALAKYQAESLRMAAANPEAFAVLVRAKSLEMSAKEAANRAAQAKSLEMNAKEAANRVAEAKSLETNAKEAANRVAEAKSLETNAQNLVNAQRQLDAVYKSFGKQAEAVQVLARSQQFAQVAARYPTAFIAAAQTQTFSVLLSNASLADALVKATMVDSTLLNAQEQK